MIVVIHVLLVGLAAWGVFQRKPWVHVPAGVILVSEMAGYFLSKAVRNGEIFLSDLVVYWMGWGPLFIPWLLLQASDLLWLILPPIIAGIAVAAASWIVLWRRSQRRVWTYAALGVGVLGAWLVAEIEVEVVMRRAAPGCEINRPRAIEMLVNGFSYPAVRNHGFAYNPHTQLGARWSFRNGYSRDLHCLAAPSP